MGENLVGQTGGGRSSEIEENVGTVFAKTILKKKKYKLVECREYYWKLFVKK